MYPCQHGIAVEGSRVTDAGGVDEGAEWKRFMRNHWSMVAAFAVACILAAVGAVYVFWWFTRDAQSTDLVPKTLGLWTMANLVNFMLYAIFWELVLVGIPI